jgi:hypothetical protein
MTMPTPTMTPTLIERSFMSSFLTQQNLILCVGVLLLLAPVIKTLIVSYLRPGAPGVGDFQTRVVWDLLTLNDKLQAKGHDKASEICKDQIGRAHV